jgi:excisionase family DNA binding protein
MRVRADRSVESSVMTVAELSTYLRIHRSTIYRLLKQGRLPAFRIGSDWRFNKEAIDAWRLGQ